MNEDYTKILAPYREKIDRIDDAIVDLLVERERVIRKVAALKAEKNIPPVLPERVDEVRERNKARAISHGMDGHYVEEIFRKTIDLSCDIEHQAKDQHDA